MNILIILVYTLLSVSGVVFFKLGSTQELTLEVTASAFCLKISWLSILGLVFYVISFLIYMGLVAKTDLGYLVPVCTGVVYLMTLSASVLIFKESFTATDIVGSLLILGGVILMNIKK